MLQFVLQTGGGDGFTANFTNLFVQIFYLLLEAEFEVFGPAVELLNLGIEPFAVARLQIVKDLLLLAA